MKSIALAASTIAIVATVALAQTSSTLPTCQCPKPPGGRLTCSANQIATCDPRTGECECTCTDTTPRRSRTEYVRQLIAVAYHQPDAAVQLDQEPFKSSAASLKRYMPRQYELEVRLQNRTSTVFAGVPSFVDEVLSVGIASEVTPAAITLFR